MAASSGLWKGALPLERNLFVRALKLVLLLCLLDCKCTVNDPVHLHNQQLAQSFSLSPDRPDRRRVRRKGLLYAHTLAAGRNEARAV